MTVEAVNALLERAFTDSRARTAIVEVDREELRASGLDDDEVGVLERSDVVGLDRIGVKMNLRMLAVLLRRPQLAWRFSAAEYVPHSVLGDQARDVDRG